MDLEFAKIGPFVIKGIDLERRVFYGIATTPDVDRQGQSIDPLGATFTNPIPLLLAHRQDHPIGMVTLMPPTADGIAFEATMPVLTTPGPLKDRVDDAWQSIREKLISSVSIGLRVLKFAERGKQGIVDILQSEILELSVVTIPSNRRASILLVKSLAAFGPEPSGVSDPLPVVHVAKATPVMTNREQITALENTRAAKVAQMAAMMKTAADKNETFSAEDADKYDGLEVEVKSVDGHLRRWRSQEALELVGATRVEAKSVEQASAVRGGSPIISVKANVPPGTAFIRYCQAQAFGRGDSMRAIRFAEQWQDSTPEVALVLKAAVAPGTISDATWAGPLVQLKPLANEFMELLRPKTVMGQIPNLHTVPFNIQIAAQTGGGTYQWVGQGAPKPVGSLAFDTLTLGITKCAGIIVITDELARLSSPSAEDAIRKDMIAGIAHFLDVEFTDPAKAPVANVAPGSITNGVTPITSSGSAPVNARADIQALVQALTAAGISAKGAALLMSEGNAAALGGSLNPLGQPLFPGLSANGGGALGVTVIVSQVLGPNIILLQPDDVFVADDGGVTIDVSREASVQMNSAPTHPPDATTVYTNFWQNNLVGLRAERYVNWKRGRPGCVQYTTQTYTDAFINPGNGGTPPATRASK